MKSEKDMFQMKLFIFNISNILDLKKTFLSKEPARIRAVNTIVQGLIQEADKLFGNPFWFLKEFDKPSVIGNCGLPMSQFEGPASDVMAQIL